MGVSLSIYSYSNARSGLCLRCFRDDLDVIENEIVFLADFFPTTSAKLVFFRWLVQPLKS